MCRIFRLFAGNSFRSFRRGGRLIEDARNGREGMIGGVAFSQSLNLRIFGNVADTAQLPRFLSPD
jgi:hypothetical protein